MRRVDQETLNIATKKPHVAVIASPGLGHVIPLLELSKCLVTHHDYHVSFLVITTTTESSAAQDQLLHSSTLPPSLRVVDLPPVDDASITTADMRILTRIAVIVEASLEKSLKSVLVELGDVRALVIDLFCTKAFEICSELSIPVYSFYTASVALFTFSLYLPILDREVVGEFVDLPEPIKVPGCTPIRTQDLLDQVKDRKNDEYAWFLLHCRRSSMTSGVFLNSWEDLEPIALTALREHPFYKQIRAPPFHPVGPLIRRDKTATELGSELKTWLDEQPQESVLLVSLGSGGTLTAEQLVEMAWGLELSQQRFVLVVRMPSDVSASEAYFNVGNDVVDDPKAYLPEGFLDRTEGKGVVVPSWIPQVGVLQHPSTGGFLTHCGWNSTLESVSFGVPMIAWPLYAEQRMNATILAEEVGVAIKPAMGGGKVVGREEIERVIRVVMEGEIGKFMRERVRELKEKASKALEFGGSSWESLASVANQWKEKPNAS